MAATARRPGRTVSASARARQVDMWSPTAAARPRLLAVGGGTTSLQHLQSQGRLHHQAGDPHPGAPEDQRGHGPGHRPCAGVRHALHELPVQEPEAGALLTVGASPPCAPQLLEMW